MFHCDCERRFYKCLKKVNGVYSYTVSWVYMFLSKSCFILNKSGKGKKVHLSAKMTKSSLKGYYDSVKSWSNFGMEKVFEFSYQGIQYSYMVSKYVIDNTRDFSKSGMNLAFGYFGYALDKTYRFSKSGVALVYDYTKPLSSRSYSYFEYGARNTFDYTAGAIKKVNDVSMKAYRNAVQRETVVLEDTQSTQVM